MYLASLEDLTIYLTASPPKYEPCNLDLSCDPLSSTDLDSTLSTTPDPLGSQLNPHVGSLSFDHTVSTTFDILELKLTSSGPQGQWPI